MSPSSPSSQPWAVRMTADTVVGEEALLHEVARERHPGCHWWWGRRVIGASARAICYVCDDVIDTWHSRWPFPIHSGTAIVEHRDRHLGGRTTTTSAEQETPQ